MPEVELAAGTVEYEDTGGDGPVLVLLHGLTMDGSLWRKVVPGLAPDYRRVVPTLPLGGHRRPMRPGDRGVGQAQCRLRPAGARGLGDGGQDDAAPARPPARSERAGTWTASR